jgi:hypothetical protein
MDSYQSGANDYNSLGYTYKKDLEILSATNTLAYCAKGNLKFITNLYLIGH